MHTPVFAPNSNPNNTTSSQLISNRDLIREYLYRTRAPPPIFAPPKFATYDTKQLVDMAYKHPHILGDEIATTDDDDDDDGAYNVSDHELKYSEYSSIELLNAGNDGVNAIDSRIKTNGDRPNTEKAIAFSSISLFSGSYVNKMREDDCKLIGKVNPILVKTWEKLNGRRSHETEQSFDSDRTSVEVKPKAAPRRSLLASKQRPIDSDSSGHFYDSIDNESVFTQDEEDAMITSICHEIEDISAGGEGMAEVPYSFTDNKAMLCWSTDSDKINVNP